MRLKVLISLVALCFGCSKGVTNAAMVSNGEVEDVVTSEETEDASPDLVEEEIGEEAAYEEVSEVEEEAEEPEEIVEPTIGEKFIAAGGLDLCKAAVYVLSPDLRLDSCNNRREEEDREACRIRREPLQAFVDTVCTTSIEEAARWNFDPLLPIQVMEREASLGRVRFDPHRRSFSVSADVCGLSISKSNIESREPHPRREGVEVMEWRWGSGRLNRQGVRVLQEDEERIVVDTCVAGEAGLFQLVPGNFRRGTPIPGTEETLDGSHEERRERLIEDPVLNIKIGCKELAEHRDMFPEEERADWWEWIGTYNTGSTTRGDHWYVYTKKLMRTYVRVCREGWITVEEGAMSIPVSRMIHDVWPECARVEEALERYENRDD